MDLTRSMQCCVPSWPVWCWAVSSLPAASNTHLPAFLKDYERIKSAGVDRLICLSVNDAFVMHGTQRQHITTQHQVHVHSAHPPYLSDVSLGGGH